MIELLFRPGPPSSEPIPLLPELPGVDLTKLTATLLSNAGGYWRAFPEPAPGTRVREWYADLWQALRPDEQASLVMAAGSGAIWLAPILGDRSEIFAVVREPLQALVAIDSANVPKQSQLQRLGAAGENARMDALRPFANPQARALLAPWIETDELPVSFGPPPDADTWRALLFEQQVPKRQFTRRTELGPVAHQLARRVGCSRKLVAEIGTERVSGRRPAGRSRRHQLLLDLNWLDAELHNVAGGSAGADDRRRNDRR